MSKYEEEIGRYTYFRDRETEFGWGVRDLETGKVVALIGDKGIAFGVAAALNGENEKAEHFLLKPDFIETDWGSNGYLNPDKEEEYKSVSDVFLARMQHTIEEAIEEYISAQCLFEFIMNSRLNTERKERLREQVAQIERKGKVCRLDGAIDFLLRESLARYFEKIEKGIRLRTGA